MKKIILLLAMGIAVFMASCTKEGPAGPKGDPGANGTNGTNGVDGEDGVDATITCGECHEMSDGLTAIMAQYHQSKHFTGVTVFEGNRTTCSPCHSSQGYRESLQTGFFNAGAYENPAPINCRTCHKIHETYTSEDWNFRSTAAVRSRMDSTHITFDMGTSNICVSCHQARVVSPYPNIASTDSVKLTSSRYGTHYGPQANIIAGLGKSSGVEIPGSVEYANSSHSALVDNGCVHCHMATPIGTLAGGHAWYASNEEEGLVTSGCSPCHTSSEANTLVEEVQTEITGLLDQLKAKLIEKGLLKSDGSTVVTGKNFSQMQIAALLNYKMCYYEASHGVHNYKYTKALLTNSFEALN
ncbi:MAG TPA: hypothetical protein PLP88_08400 [Bacteroidales bacterium]|nr:hypothetical protein [Bacteroidales bacterium]